MKNALIIIALFFAIFYVAKTVSDSKQDHAHSHSIMGEIKSHDSVLTYDLPQVGDWDSSELVLVHSRLENVKDFHTVGRTHTIKSFPCSNCHSVDIETLKSHSKSQAENAHWTVELNHANESTMNCSTCHDYDNLDQLKGLGEGAYSFDESFKMCGQCHSKQLDDWQGGAHGKSLNGWQTPRVNKQCTSCHNAHDPGFPHRFPSRLKTISTEH